MQEKTVKLHVSSNPSSNCVIYNYGSALAGIKVVSRSLTSSGNLRALHAKNDGEKSLITLANDFCAKGLRPRKS